MKTALIAGTVLQRVITGHFHNCCWPDECAVASTALNPNLTFNPFRDGESWKRLPPCLHHWRFPPPPVLFVACGCGILHYDVVRGTILSQPESSVQLLECVLQGCIIMPKNGFLIRSVCWAKEGAVCNSDALQQRHLSLCLCETARATKNSETTVLPAACDQTESLLRPSLFWQFSRFNVWSVNFSYSLQCWIACHCFFQYNVVRTCCEVCAVQF
jgi:hypothetical protein